MRVRAKYVVESDRFGQPLVIRDVGGPEDMTVTNDTEAVVEELVERGLLPARRKLYYYDSDGDLAEITVCEGRYTRFSLEVDGVDLWLLNHCWHGTNRTTIDLGNKITETFAEICCFCGKPRFRCVTSEYRRPEGHGEHAVMVLVALPPTVDIPDDERCPKRAATSLVPVSRLGPGA